MVGDDEVGPLPEDYANFHYPAVAVVGEDVFISYAVSTYYTENDSVKNRAVHRTRILPVGWFYD